MKLARAIETVNTAKGAEAYVDVLETEQYLELCQFVLAARVCAVYAAPEPAIDPELAGALQTLILCATKGITHGTELRNAIIIARRYLPRSQFALADYPELRDAVQKIREYATKIDADGLPMPYWPDRVTERQAMHIAERITRALQVLDFHSDLINSLNAGGRYADDISPLIAEAVHRTENMTVAEGADIRRWACHTQVGLAVLNAYLPKTDYIPA